MSALIATHATCLPPKKCHIVRMCMLGTFALTYFIGAGSTMHNNKDATLGFCVVGSVLAYYTVVMICIGWKTLDQQLEEAVDKVVGLSTRTRRPKSSLRTPPATTPTMPELLVVSNQLRRRPT